MEITSKLVQPPVPSSSISIGRGPRFPPPASGDPSISTAWLLSVSPRKETCSTHLTRAFMLCLSLISEHGFYPIPNEADNFMHENLAVAQGFGARQKGQGGGLNACGEGGRRLDGLEPGTAEHIGGARHMPGMR